MFGAEGPAEILDEAELAHADWLVPVRGPLPAQTVLLLAVQRPLNADQRRRVSDAITSVKGPKSVDFDSHIVWTEQSERLESVASARGARDTAWVPDVLARLSSVADIRLAGRTFPIALSQ